MPRKAHSDEQISAALQDRESGTKVAELCRRMGISQAAYFVEEEVRGFGGSELRELRQLREENSKLKQWPIFRSIDMSSQEIVAKKL